MLQLLLLLLILMRFRIRAWPSLVLLTSHRHLLSSPALIRFSQNRVVCGHSSMPPPRIRCFLQQRFSHGLSRVAIQLLSSISSAFNCSRWSKRLMPPLLPVRAFGAELNYLQALAHHAARANRAAETSGDEHTCVSLNGALTLHLPSETSNFRAGVALQDDSPTSIYRGGWFISPNVEHAAAAQAASPASLGPLDFWYTHDFF